MGNIDLLQKIEPKLNLIELAQEAVDQSNSDLSVVVKRRIVPILLSSYDPVSLDEIRKMKTFLIGEGYANTTLIEDIPTKTNFEGKYDSKFLHFLRLSDDDDYFILPIFYFNHHNGQGLGHHSELIDLITFFPGLIFVTGIFFSENSLKLNQTRVIPIQNSFQVNNYQDFESKVKEFVNSYFPFVERSLFQSSQNGSKNFYTLGISKTKRGVR